MKFLLDSVIFIDHFNGCETASTFIGVNHPEIAISAITRAEVLTGFIDEHRALPNAFLAFFPTLGIAEREADRAARLRREHGWKLPDAFQAAVAVIHGLIRVTRNTKDFPQDRFHSS